MSAPLEGITILDFTRNLAGPFCTMILGDLGARVIKVERPRVGDDTRHWRPPSWGEDSALFVSVNRNKESVVLDLDDAEGVELASRLAAKADVVIEANRPGSMAARGLGFEDLRALNDQLVYFSISGFGGIGPQRLRPGYDTIVQAASGVMSINGEPGAPPTRAGVSVVDQGTGIWAALGVLAALRRRDVTGEAQHVATSLLEVGVTWMSYYASNYLADGSVAGPAGSRHALVAPYEGFDLGGEHLFIATLNDNLFRRLCATLGVPALADDARFADNSSRLAHRDTLHELLAERLRGDGAELWEARLLEAGVPCSRIKSIDEVVADPQVEALSLLASWEHPRVPDMRLVDHPITYNGTRAFQRRPAPDLGEHTDAVRREVGLAGNENVSRTHTSTKEAT